MEITGLVFHSLVSNEGSNLCASELECVSINISSYFFFRCDPQVTSYSTSKLFILTSILTTHLIFFFFSLLDSTTNRHPGSASDSNCHLVLRPGPGCTSETRHFHATCAQSTSASQKGWWMLISDRLLLIFVLSSAERSTSIFIGASSVGSSCLFFSVIRLPPG